MTDLDRLLELTSEDLDHLLELISEDLDGYTLDEISEKMKVIDSLKKSIEEKLEGKK